MHFSNYLVLLAAASAIGAPDPSRAVVLSRQSELQSQIGSLRSRFTALCGETSSALDSGALGAFGSLSGSLQEDRGRTDALCQSILEVLASAGTRVASEGEAYADADDSARGRFEP